MFPKIKKKIKKFLFEETGKISKKSILTLGTYAVLFSALGQAAAAHGKAEPATDGPFTMQHLDSVDAIKSCTTSIPQGFNVDFSGSDVCTEDAHNKGAGHDNAYAHTEGKLHIKTGLFDYEKQIHCSADEHDKGGCGHVSSYGVCQITFSGAAHTNSITLSKQDGIIKAAHEHGADPKRMDLCLGVFSKMEGKIDGNFATDPQLKSNDACKDGANRWGGNC